MSTDVSNSSDKIKHNDHKHKNYHLYQNARIIQKNLVYVIGLSSTLSDKTILSSKEYFGQYGKITKLILNNSKGYITKGIQGPTYSAYIGYSTPFEACLAILSTDDYYIKGSTIRSSFGTTKYCTYFLKGYDCPNPNCLFIHNFVNEDEIINKDDMVFDKNIFFQQQILAMKISNIFSPEIKRKVLEFKRINNSALPHPSDIYKRDIIVEQKEKNLKQEQLSKIFNKDDYENYFGDKNELTNLKKKKEEKYIKFASRQSSEVSKGSFLTNSSSVVSAEKELKKHFSFTKRSKSRFDFALDDDQEEIEIPDFILEIVNTSLAYFSKFKKFLDYKVKLIQFD